MNDIILHETLATHLPMVRLASAWLEIPLEKMLPIEAAERRHFETAIVKIKHAIDHYAEILQRLELALEVAHLQAAFVRE
jgi:hypothetical protein